MAKKPPSRAAWQVDGRDVLTVVMQRPLPKRSPSHDPSAPMRFGSAGLELETRDWRLLPGPSLGSFTRYGPSRRWGQALVTRPRGPFLVRERRNPLPPLDSCQGHRRGDPLPAGGAAFGVIRYGRRCC
jgi:hypothetical protein